MKKIISVLLALTLAFSMAVLFSGCGGKKDNATTTTAESSSNVETTAETTANANLPKAGDTLTFGSVKVVVPDGWSVKDTYQEGKKAEIQPANASIESVDVNVHQVYGDEHAKEWADSINGNYGGNKEIDQVEIAGQTFYRVKADAEQNICFADLDDNTFIEVAVMFMPWEDGEPVLNNITFG